MCVRVAAQMLLLDESLGVHEELPSRYWLVLGQATDGLNSVWKFQIAPLAPRGPGGATRGFLPALFSK